jgi:hypothetical protein
MFIDNVGTLLSQTRNISEQLMALRKLYEAGNIANQVADGNVPYPENEKSIRDGISLEFRYFFVFWLVRPRDADSAIIETSRSNTLAVKIMPCATYLSW